MKALTLRLSLGGAGHIAPPCEQSPLYHHDPVIARTQWLPSLIDSWRDNPFYYPAHRPVTDSKANTFRPEPEGQAQQWDLSLLSAYVQQDLKELWEVLRLHRRVPRQKVAP